MSNNAPRLVKALREAQHLTQDDLAALMGLSARSGRVIIAYWESGQRSPSPPQMARLAACLGRWPIEGAPDLRAETVGRALRS